MVAIQCAKHKDSVSAGLSPLSSGACQIFSSGKVGIFKNWRNKIIKNQHTNYIPMQSFYAMFCEKQRKIQVAIQLSEQCFANCSNKTKIQRQVIQRSKGHAKVDDSEHTSTNHLTANVQ